MIPIQDLIHVLTTISIIVTPMSYRQFLLRNHEALIYLSQAQLRHLLIANHGDFIKGKISQSTSIYLRSRIDKASRPVETKTKT
ncbi:hypothetical protein GcC1_062010 [Golovinomyces cichoracearum]|uniref:Uncharacterized protein n=1 Tax=Golovinomyces cichoracearum TaxID=62708 RepID=A0A420ISY1_9PEZI|nr:hypothetical protein GcC1_062010 [Golovinomyces cichoracearum]